MALTRKAYENKSMRAKSTSHASDRPTTRIFSRNLVHEEPIPFSFFLLFIPSLFNNLSIPFYCTLFHLSPRTMARVEGC